MRMRPFYFSVVSVLIFLCLSLEGAEPVLPPQFQLKRDLYARFSAFRPQQKKLDIGTVADIIQDRIGFIWLAGDQGLGRFDGYEFKIYKAVTNQTSIPGNIISSFEIDETGRLWIGTSGGLCYYRENTDDFQTVYGNSLNPEGLNDSLYVRELVLDTDSLILFATLTGQLKRISLRDFRIVTLAAHAPVNQPYYRYHAIERVNDTAVFFGSRGHGPCLFNSKNNNFRYLRTHKNELDGAKRESDLSMAKKENDSLVWIGSLEGLYLYNLRTDFFYKYYTGTVYDLEIDRDGHYWIGTGDGVIELDLMTGQGTHYLPNVNDPESLGGERVYKIFEDRSGRIWFAHEYGVSTYLPPKPGVRYIFHIPGEANTPASSRITALAAAPNGNVWIGTANEGLDLFDVHSGNFLHHKPADNQAIISEHIKSLRTDANRNLYIGYWSGRGFGYYDVENSTFEKYRYYEDGLTKDWYNDFAFTTDGKVYLGFWGGPGLTIFDPKTKAFDETPAAAFRDAYEARLITCLLKDDKNLLWVGTTNSGVHLWDETKRLGDKDIGDQIPGFGLSHTEVYDLQQDSLGKIYAAGDGLFVYDGKKQFLPVGLRTGFEKLEIYRLLPYSASDIWLLTSKGLLKFNPKTGWLNDYSMLVNMDFKANQAAALVLGNGQIILGGTNGLAVIETDLLGMQHAFPKVFLTQLDVNNERLIPFLGNHKKIKLNHDQNFFTINIGTDRWERNQPYTYYYRMDGFEESWVKLTNGQRSVNFTNVPPGQYVFHMRTGDAYGNMGEQEATLTIQINSPWYKRWWFIMLVVLAVAGLSTFFWYIRLKEVKLHVLNMELNQKLLRLQMNPHFIFNSLTSIQNYIYSNQTHLAGQYLSDFAKLIRLILENSRHEYISLEKEVETISLYMELQLLRFSNNMEFKVDIDPLLDPEVTFLPPMLAQPFLENALEHGIKHKPKGGRIEVAYKLIGDQIRFEVRDNGVGLTASEKLPKEAGVKKESLSTAICRERLQILEHKFKRKMPLLIEEIVTSKGVEGTRVVFDIPLDIKHKIKTFNR